MSLPLHKSLIVTADTEKVRVIGGETNSNDMLGVASQGNRLVTLSARVPEYIHQTIVIPSSNECAVIGESDVVNVSSVCACRKHAVYEPSKLSRICGPFRASCV